MTKEELAAALEEAKARAKTDGSGNDVPELVLRILTAASETDTVREALKDVKAGRALLRFTDIGRAIEFKAGAGELHAELAELRGPGPKVDATSATWLGPARFTAPIAPSRSASSTASSLPQPSASAPPPLPRSTCATSVR